jgi:hypothetical protein
MRPQIWPVIHIDTPELAYANAKIAFDAGCVGVFLIHMDGEDEMLDPIGLEIQRRHPDHKIGVNYLSMGAEVAVKRAIAMGFQASWSDNPGVRSDWIDGSADRIGELLAAHPKHSFFASVAFKYQKRDPHPGEAAKRALGMGMIPTTSGEATGKAPAESKLTEIRGQIGPAAPLALASGVTPENGAALGRYLTHILVSTGISASFYRFDPGKLAALVRAIDTIDSSKARTGY